jgi:solute carrier family 25 phosphate transporter 23/24/25/41
MPSTCAQSNGTDGLSVSSKSTRLLHSDSLQTLLAGGLAGAVSRTAVAPLDRVKILLQVQGLSVPNGATPRYTSLTQALQSLWMREGLKGLFKGNGANCQRIIPQSGLQYLCYDRFLELLVGDAPSSEITALHRLLAGALAGATATTATYPMDLMRARISVDFKGEYGSFWGGMRRIATSEGPPGLYRGLVPSLVGIVPYVGIDFMIFGALKQRFQSEGGELSVAAKLCAGGLAGICGQTVAYPLDTIRRILQVQDYASGHKVKTAGNVKYTGMYDCFVKVLRRDGLQGLYRGYIANLVKAAPSVAISFVMFEWARDRLRA